MKLLSSITALLLFVGSITITSGCKSTKTSENSIVAQSQITSADGIRRMPKAIIYRTNGQWNKNVAVTLNDSHTQLIYYPSCYDVSSDTEPIALENGWLLDRQGGISINAAFLKWTMAEYHKLETTPSVDEIMKSIIPDAIVVEVVELPMITTEAQRDTSIVNDIIRQQYLR